MNYQITGTLSCITENVAFFTGYHRYILLGPEKPKAVQIQITYGEKEEEKTSVQMFYGRSPSLYLGKEVHFEETVEAEGTVKTFVQKLTCGKKTLEGMIKVDFCSLENDK